MAPDNADADDAGIDLDRLATEARNPRSVDLDKMGGEAIARLMAEEERRSVEAVRAAAVARPRDRSGRRPQAHAKAAGAAIDEYNATVKMANEVIKEPPGKRLSSGT